MNSIVKAEKIMELLESKKGIDIRIIDIKDISLLGDYFVICSGTSNTHIRTLADEIISKMEEAGDQILHREGYNSAGWVLLDYGDVVIHIFHQEYREFYNLERLWSDGVVIQR